MFVLALKLLFLLLGRWVFILTWTWHSFLSTSLVFSGFAFDLVMMVIFERLLVKSDP